MVILQGTHGPLAIVVQYDHHPGADSERMLRLLLSHPKVDINQEGDFYTPFQYACYSGQLWAVKILLEHGGIQWGHEEEGWEASTYDGYYE